MNLFQDIDIYREKTVAARLPIGCHGNQRTSLPETARVSMGAADAADAAANSGSRAATVCWDGRVNGAGAGSLAGIGRSDASDGTTTVSVNVDGNCSLATHLS